MAALPLQGIAAASMLFCGQAAHASAQQPAGHDAGGHGVAGHEHEGHQHEGHAGHDEGASGDTHACPICASCCNLVALSEAPTLSLGPSGPLRPPLQDASRVLTREAPAPDKPPRA